MRRPPPSVTPEVAAKIAAVYSRPEPEAPDVPEPEHAPAVTVPELPPTPPTTSQRRRRARLYDPQRRGYLRSSTEEGIGDELKAMFEEACGSPFFDAPKPAVSETSDVLARLRAKAEERRAKSAPKPEPAGAPRGERPALIESSGEASRSSR